MNILIVKYLPSGEESNTLKLLNHFKSKIKSHSVEEIDLIKSAPIVHNLETMKAYKQRNFGGLTLDSGLAKAIEPMDKLTQQFSKADLIVLVTPMHNFSLPGIVKTYFDAIMQSGVVFKYEGEKQIGLMKKSKFLTLYTSMGSYTGEYGFMDNLKTILKIELDFMGFGSYEFVHASTGNTATVEIHMKKAIEKIDAVANKWIL